jgi:hypothetical protein
MPDPGEQVRHTLNPRARTPGHEFQGTRIESSSRTHRITASDRLEHSGCRLERSRRRLEHSRCRLDRQLDCSGCRLVRSRRRLEHPDCRLEGSRPCRVPQRQPLPHLLSVVSFATTRSVHRTGLEPVSPSVQCRASSPLVLMPASGEELERYRALEATILPPTRRFGIDAGGFSS